MKYEEGAVTVTSSAALSLKRIAKALERQNELLEQANKIGERNVAAAERIELAQHEPRLFGDE